jgi:hypothetical protein
MANITLTKEIDSFLQNPVGLINKPQFFPNGTYYIYTDNVGIIRGTQIQKTGDTLDFSLYPESAKLLYKFDTSIFTPGFGIPSHITAGFEKALEQIIGGQYLTGLANSGTSIAFNASGNNMSDTAIDSFFTDLPTALYTATLNFQNNTGSATCDPTIATAKGYTVIT